MGFKFGSNWKSQIGSPRPFRWGPVLWVPETARPLPCLQSLCVSPRVRPPPLPEQEGLPGPSPQAGKAFRKWPWKDELACVALHEISVHSMGPLPHWLVPIALQKVCLGKRLNSSRVMRCAKADLAFYHKLPLPTPSPPARREPGWTLERTRCLCFQRQLPGHLPKRASSFKGQICGFARFWVP